MVLTIGRIQAFVMTGFAATGGSIAEVHVPLGTVVSRRHFPERGLGERPML